MFRLLFGLLIFAAHGEAQMNFPKLPKDFRFCVSTAAHQIEGGNNNSDWWNFEQTPGNIKLNQNSSVATDSWGHLSEDLQNLNYLGVDTYRFSIEWAKVEPKAGVFDEKELDRYLNLIDKLQAQGIEPMVTLYHFTLPQWVSSQGGWEWDGIVPAFETFVQHVVRRVGPRVKLWITLNEPMTLITAGYMSTIFPPQVNDPSRIGLPMANMVRAHAKAYHSIHTLLDSDQFKPQVGLAHHLRNFDPNHRFNPVDRYIAQKFDQIFNWAIPGALQTGELKFNMPTIAKANFIIPEAIQTQDFFGINYYSRDLVGLNPFRAPFIKRLVSKNAPVTDLNWEIYPEGLDRLLTEIRTRYPALKIWITENGLADQNDSKRIPYINAHLNVVSEQIRNGAPIEGYCHWTLNDNFEWAEGYTAHFGFYSLEPETLKRIARPSAKYFSDLVHSTRNLSPDSKN